MAPARRIISIVDAGGSSGPPAYTHVRFRVTAQFVWTASGTRLLASRTVRSGSQYISYYFNTANGDGDGYVVYATNDYMVVDGLHVNPSFPADAINPSADIQSASDRADAIVYGLCDPLGSASFGNDIDSTVDFEPCHQDGTRDDD